MEWLMWLLTSAVLRRTFATRRSGMIPITFRPPPGVRRSSVTLARVAWVSGATTSRTTGSSRRRFAPNLLGHHRRGNHLLGAGYRQTLGILESRHGVAGLHVDFVQ